MPNIINNESYMLDLCVRMAHHSTAIEGNTLSQNDSASIILDGYIPRAVREQEFYEIRNYKFVLPFFIDNLRKQTKLDNELIKDFHKIIMQDLIYNNGSFKTIENIIIGADFEPTKPYLVATEMKNIIDNLYYRFSNYKNDDDKLRAILDFHIKFERIHPFSDGNGRSGRLLMVYSCLEQNLAPIVIPQDKKVAYISYLRNADIDNFLIFAKELQKEEQLKQDKFINNALDSTKSKNLNKSKQKPKLNNFEIGM
ncbi:cell filamentation protein Fic [Helicobacter sp. 16-1353]|uniref:Fic family protein n=1 Tax=Helicobacter sp. 16-1353 TaxID=2004996 RepID=UPI000DCD0E83|nr:Fic family protein [Helicobacter sp. 16-1353]RAX54200.1 cell filamentation protein Fic [Helicobacter sp. 16-1353]